MKNYLNINSYLIKFKYANILANTHKRTKIIYCRWNFKYLFVTVKLTRRRRHELLKSKQTDFHNVSFFLKSKLHFLALKKLSQARFLNQNKFIRKCKHFICMCTFFSRWICESVSPEGTKSWKVKIKFMPKIKPSKSRRNTHFSTARCRWQQEILRRISKSTPSIDADKGGNWSYLSNQYIEKRKKLTGCKYWIFSTRSPLVKNSRFCFFISNFFQKCYDPRFRPNNFELSRLLSRIYLKGNYQKMMQSENSTEFVATILLIIICSAIDLQEWQTSCVYEVCLHKEGFDLFAFDSRLVHSNWRSTRKHRFSYIITTVKRSLPSSGLLNSFKWNFWTFRPNTTVEKNSISEPTYA